MRPDYRRSIVNLTSSLLKHFDLETYHPSLSALDEVLKRDYKHILLVVLDGMGENILDAHLKQEDLLKQARKSTLTSVFPATTTAATTSLMSGKTPYEHGFLGWNQFFKNEDILKKSSFFLVYQIPISRREVKQCIPVPITIGGKIIAVSLKKP